jgi:hypothetical protein
MAETGARGSSSHQMISFETESADAGVPMATEEKKAPQKHVASATRVRFLPRSPCFQSYTDWSFSGCAVKYAVRFPGSGKRKKVFRVDDE